MSETLTYSVTATQLLNKDNTIVFEVSHSNDDLLFDIIESSIKDACIAHFGASPYQVTRVCRVTEPGVFVEMYCSPI